MGGKQYKYYLCAGDIIRSKKTTAVSHKKWIHIY